MEGMSVQGGRKEFLENPAIGDHISQIYQEEDFLVEAVGFYAGSGIRRGDAAVLIATPAHRQAFARRLESFGWDAGELRAQGRLRFYDARDTLSRFLVNGMPDRAAFQRTLGKIFQETAANAPRARIRVYGEMVNLLWLE